MILDHEKLKPFLVAMTLEERKKHKSSHVQVHILDMVGNRICSVLTHLVAYISWHNTNMTYEHKSHTYVKGYVTRKKQSSYIEKRNIGIKAFRNASSMSCTTSNTTKCIPSETFFKTQRKTCSSGLKTSKEEGNLKHLSSQHNPETWN